MKEHNSCLNSFNALVVARPTGVYMLDFFLLPYSVLCTVESLSLLYLLYLDLYVLGDNPCISSVNQTSMCLDPLQN